VSSPKVQKLQKNTAEYLGAISGSGGGDAGQKNVDGVHICGQKTKPPKAKPFTATRTNPALLWSHKQWSHVRPPDQKTDIHRVVRTRGRGAAGRWRGYIGAGRAWRGRGDMRPGAPVGTWWDDRFSEYPLQNLLFQWQDLGQTYHLTCIRF